MFQSPQKLCISMLLSMAASVVTAGVVTIHTSRAGFDLAVGTSTVETFTNSAHNPISGTVLNSSSTFTPVTGTPLFAGDIQPGVTYSSGGVRADIGTSFGIEIGSGFTGGFLASRDAQNTILTVNFDSPVQGLGFDTNSLMDSFYYTIYFAAGGLFQGFINLTNSVDLAFVGFSSTGSDITYFQVDGRFAGSGYSLALDNFTFGRQGSNEAPEPGVLTLVALGLVVLASSARSRRTIRPGVSRIGATHKLI